MKLLRFAHRIRVSRRTLLIAAIVIALAVSGIAAWMIKPGAHLPLQAYADQVMTTCAKTSYPPSCYDTEIPKLMDKGLTMEQAFQVTSIIQNKTQGYFFCHVLGHNLAAKETAKDPSKWTEVIGRCPVGQCSNGCLHGAAQERFRAESLTPTQVQGILPQLSQICTGSTRDYTGLEQASCVHALGHLAMYLTNADIKAATGVCDVVAKQGDHDNTTTCYEGAYMQIFQPLEPEDFGLVRDIAPTTTTAAETYCDTFTGERQAACHRESWPLYRTDLFTAPGVQAFCALTPGAYDQQRCYNALFYILTAQFQFDVKRITDVCTGLPNALEGQCFANAASRAIETDYRLAPTSVALCKLADEKGVGDRCYHELLFYSTFNYHAGTPEFTGFCAQLPGTWKDQCLAGDGAKYSPGAPIVRDDIVMP